jgi:hypothetical protein
MSFSQTVSTVYGFVIPTDEIDAFLRKALVKFGKPKSAKNANGVDGEQEYEDFFFNPYVQFLTKDEKWANLGFDLSYDETYGVRTFIIYDRTWCHSVSERHTSVLPVALKDPSTYEGPLTDFIELMELSDVKCSWIFSATVS